MSIELPGVLSASELDFSISGGGLLLLGCGYELKLEHLGLCADEAVDENAVQASFDIFKQKLTLSIGVSKSREIPKAEFGP